MKELPRKSTLIDISEASMRLGISVYALDRWIRQGSIPCIQQGEKIVFDRSRLKAWSDSHNMTWIETPPGKTESSLGEIGISGAIRRGGVYTGITGVDVKQVLASVSHTIQLPSTVDRQQLLKRLLEREELASTGIGKGVAVPHPRTPLKTAFAEPTIFVCFLEKEVDYEAVDGEPVFVLFLMFSPNTKAHLQMLARLGFCLRDETFVEFLRKPCDADSICQRIEEMKDKMGFPRPR